MAYDKERVREYNRRYREKHRAEIQAKDRARYHADRAKINHRRRLKNRDPEVKAKRKVRDRRWRQAHLEERRAQERVNSLRYLDRQALRAAAAAREAKKAAPAPKRGYSGDLKPGHI